MPLQPERKRLRDGRAQLQPWVHTVAAVATCTVAGDTEAELLNAELYSRMDLFFAATSMHRAPPPPSPPEAHGQHAEHSQHSQHGQYSPLSGGHSAQPAQNGQPTQHSQPDQHGQQAGAQAGQQTGAANGQQPGQQNGQQMGQPGLASAAAPLLAVEEGGPSTSFAAAEPTPRPSAYAAVASTDSEPASPTYAAAGVAQRSSHAAPSHDY